MNILDNKKELKRLHEIHNDSVKKKYQCSFEQFWDWIAMDANQEEKYIEIPRHQTLSGHAEILDW